MTLIEIPCDAVATLNDAFGPYNVTIVEVDAADHDFADVQIDVDKNRRRNQVGNDT